VRVAANGGSDGPESSAEAIYQAWSGGASNGGGKATPEIFETLVAQVLVQPPGCPRPLPALFYVGRGGSDDQLVYTGGWVIDDAALYEESATVLSVAGPTRVVGVERSDLGDSFEDVAGGVADWDWPRVRRGARFDSGTGAELVETGVLSEQGYDVLVRKKPGRDGSQGAAGEPGENYRFLTHVSVDAPVLHLRSGSRTSRDVKFKAGAELSKAVN
jgi:hypothetical protein